MGPTLAGAAAALRERSLLWHDKGVIRGRPAPASWPLIAMLAACEAEVEPPPQPAPAAAPEGPVRALEGAPALATATVPPGPVVEAAAIPIGSWVLPRERVVVAEPREGASIVGRIAADEPFAVLEIVSGEGCRGERWARVDPEGFVCLGPATETLDDPRALPRVLAHDTLPYLYARLPKSPDPNAEAVPRWRSRGALYRGEPPESFLERDRIYAFQERRRSGRFGPLLVDERRGVVRERDVKRLKQSELVGHELEDLPAEGTRLAWSIAWPRTDVFAEPGASTQPSGGIPFQTTVAVHDEARWIDGEGWYEVAAGGWVQRDQIRRWLPGEPEADVDADEIWVDIELHQQTLALYRGQRPLFVTLVSTGTAKNPTPRGVHHVRLKQAAGKMESRDDADDPYYVENVPWVLYFQGRHALHGVAWHNRFGRRASHGCINLSPRDAERVFHALDPALPPGWISRAATDSHPGARVRVRKASAQD